MSQILMTIDYFTLVLFHIGLSYCDQLFTSMHKEIRQYEGKQATNVCF